MKRCWQEFQESPLGGETGSFPADGILAKTRLTTQGAQARYQDSRSMDYPFPEDAWKPGEQLAGSRYFAPSWEYASISARAKEEFSGLDRRADRGRGRKGAMKAVIMAGGQGSRLRPLTCDLAKPMVPVANRPMMEYIIQLLSAAMGFRILRLRPITPESIEGVLYRRVQPGASSCSIFKKAGRRHRWQCQERCRLWMTPSS